MNPPPNGSAARDKKGTESGGDTTADEDRTSASSSGTSLDDRDLESSWDDLVPPSDEHVKPASSTSKGKVPTLDDDAPATKAKTPDRPKTRGLPSSFVKPKVPKPTVPGLGGPKPHKSTRAAPPPPPTQPPPTKASTTPAEPEPAPTPVERADTGGLKPWVEPVSTKPPPPAPTEASTAPEPSDDEVVDEPAAPAKKPFKPPALPRPGMLKSGHELKSHDFRESTAEHASKTSAPSSVPKGIRPPKDPERAESIAPGQTATFINTVAVELIAAAERDSAERAAVEAAKAAEAEDAEADEAALEQAKTSVYSPVDEAPAEDGSVPHMGRAEVVGDDRESSPRRNAPLWVLGAAALAAVLLLVFSSGDDSPAETTSPASSEHKQSLAANAAQPEHSEPEPAEVVEPPPEPEPVDADAMQAGSTGATQMAIDGVDASTLDIDESILVEEEEPTEPVEAAPEPAAKPEPSPRPKKRSTRRKRKRSKPKSEPAPAPKPEPKPTPKPTSTPTPTTAKELRQEAVRQLGAGNASKAYRLAAQSNRKRRSSTALRIMVKAACRMKSQSKAKSAFDRLSIADRGGLRGECRRFGVRLGL